MLTELTELRHPHINVDLILAYIVPLFDLYEPTSEEKDALNGQIGVI